MRNSIFSWPDGAGWLVFSGRGDFARGQTENVDSRLLTQSAADGALVYIWAAGDFDTAEQYLSYLTDLGGRSGYPLDIISEDDDTIRNLLSDAGVIILGDGPDLDRLSNGLRGPAGEAILQAYVHGAAVMGTGVGAEVMGQWIIHAASQQARPGLGWLQNALIGACRVESQAAASIRQDVLKNYPLAYSIEIGSDSALALSPFGEIDVWGDRKIAISLGQSYTQHE